MVTKDELHGKVCVEEEAVRLISVRKQRDLGRNQKKTGLSRASVPGPFPPAGPYLPGSATSQNSITSWGLSLDK